MTNQFVESVTFGLITHPAKHAWPIHGCFMLTLPDDNALESRPMFSVQACREYILEGMEAGALNGDQAGELDRVIIATSLPQKLTRYDRLTKKFDPASAHRLVNRFCGQTPPEEGSGPARFVECRDGRICEQENCHQYPRHGVFYPDGINSTCADIIFSQAGGRETLRIAVESGLMLPEEAIALQDGASGLSPSANAEQADRFTSSVPRQDWFDHLDVLFGLRQIQKPARFASCREGGRCIHLYCYDDRELGVGVGSLFDAYFLTTRAYDNGMITPGEADRLKAEIPALDLPAGSERESMYTNPSFVIQEHLGRILRELSNMIIDRDASDEY